MVSSFRAELLKLRKRPAVWVMALIFFVFVALLGDLLEYVFYISQVASGNSIPGDLMRFFLPVSIARSPVASAARGDYAIGIVLGALVAGSEYEWGALKTALTQYPTRVSIYAGKLLALAVAIAFLVAVIFASGAVASLVIGLVAERQSQVASLAWPSLSDVLRSAGAEWLMLAMWTSMGTMFAVLFRSPGLGIGIGVGEWVLEQLVLTQGSLLSGQIHAVAPFLPGASYSALSTRTAGPIPSYAQMLVNVSAGHAALVLAVYTVAFVVVTGLVLKLRDVL